MRLQVPKGYPRDMAPPLPEEIRHLIDVNIHPPPSLEITLPVSLYISLGLYINKFLILLTNNIFFYYRIRNLLMYRPKDIYRETGRVISREGGG
jgi:predicted methyltransferase